MSGRRVRIHADFEKDLLAQLSWIRVHEPGQVVALEQSFDRVLELLSTFPSAGEAIDREGTVTLRKLIFPRGPLVAWYIFDAAARAGDVWLLRLFHSRQRRAAPKLRRWRKRLPR